MTQLEAVGDVHEHTDRGVEDGPGIHVSAVAVGRGVRAPEDPLAAPVDGGGDALLVEGVRGLLVVSHVGGSGTEELAGRHDGLVGRGLEGDAVVLGVDALHRRSGHRGQVEAPAAAVRHHRPADLGELGGVAVGRLPCDRLGDGVDGIGVDERNVRDDEGVPVAVDLLRGGDHGGIDRRDVGPAGGGDDVRHYVLALIEQSESSEAGVDSGVADGADDGGRLHRGGVDLAERDGDVAGELRLTDGRDDDLAGVEVVGHFVVGALDLVLDGDRVEDDRAGGELAAATGEGDGDAGVLRLPMGGGIQHVDDVDGADVADRVVEVLGDGLAEGEGVPVGRVADLRLRVDHVAQLDRSVDDPRVRVPSHEVDRSSTDIHDDGVGVGRALDLGGPELAIGSVLVCHCLFSFQSRF